MSHDKKKNVQPFEHWEEEMVNKRVRSLIGKFGLNESDFEDVKQDMLLSLYLKRESYRKDADPKKIVRRIIDDEASWLIKKLKSPRRFVQQNSVSLDVSLDEDSENTFINLLSENDALGRFGRVNLSEENEIREDFEAVFQSLTPTQKRVYLALSGSDSKTNIAKELGINRKTLYEAIRRIRMAFRNQGEIKNI